MLELSEYRPAPPGSQLVVELAFPELREWPVRLVDGISSGLFLSGVD